MQEAINSALHRVNICPVGEHMSGHRAPRVGVYRDYSRRWYIEARFNEPGARRFEQISMEAIEDMDRVADRCGAIYSED